MKVRDLPPAQLCDLCRARIAALKTDDELTLLKALCGPCEGAVASAGRPASATGWWSSTTIDLETGEETKKGGWTR